MADSDWSVSKCTTSQLKSFESVGLLVKNQYRAPSSTEVASSPQDGEFILFASQLERGLGLPTSKFFRRFLAYYAVKPSNLGPHSIE